ncbi:YbhB/YbcL family Raf kinase inhibitor-like protein [Buchananella hordeovulneris]|uniref:YbhB/YbcL family Raf kinase inhibitor-like protein n=1 Tax=Buchananella hordeovulneris TaxID=52770 RepID=UPI0026DB7F7A|nr:YbhB/YbcL family Raf kinase inhibitor-like protein [Buchananella hordeovulneris]MDO5081180.1 YbhB/YbcL family Raf kinase inhibitor-like protein [Buchananella hordeovulneris]
MRLDRPVAPDPYALLPQFPSFTLRSNDFADGESLPPLHSAQGGNVSPHLAWSGFPAETRSFVVSCFDPDAPTPAGYWHWTVVDIPATVTELAQGLGESDLLLDGAMFHVRSDGGAHTYEGAAPPPGDRPHRYIFAVHALAVDSLELTDEASPTAVAFTALAHTLARATLTGTFAH